MHTRTFLAFPLDEEVQSQLRSVQEQLETVGAHVRWTEASQLHVTVKFLGDVPDQQLPEVCDAAIEIASQIEPFDLDVGRIIAAPPHGHMRMIWVGVEEPTGRMTEMHRRLDLAYDGLGYKAETRGFHPHLTLGRIKSGQKVPQLRSAIGAMADMTFGLQPADEMIVFGSELTREGPIYTVLARAPLK